VAGSCEYSDAPSGSGATDLVSYSGLAFCDTCICSVVPFDGRMRSYNHQALIYNFTYI
jgi:hypothetical protein